MHPLLMETNGQVLPAATQTRRLRRHGLLLGTFAFTFTAIFGPVLIWTLNREAPDGPHFFTPLHRLVANVLHPGPDFTATAVLVPTHQPGIPRTVPGLGDLVGDLNLLKSPELATAVADSLSMQNRKRLLAPYATYAASGPPAFAPEILQQSRDVQSDAGTGALAVSFTHADPEIAPIVARLFAQEFIQLRARKQMDAAAADLQDVQAKLAAAHQKAETALAKMATYARAHNLAPPTQTANGELTMPPADPGARAPGADEAPVTDTEYAALQRQLPGAQAQSKKLMAQLKQLQATMAQAATPVFSIVDPLPDEGVNPKVWRMLALGLAGGVAGASAATFALACLLDRRKRWPANFDEMQV